MPGGHSNRGSTHKTLKTANRDRGAALKSIGPTVIALPGYIARTIVDSGIHVGAGSDAAAVSVFDPWLIIYYMVTGKNAAGETVNPGQQLTRAEALRLLYSRERLVLTVVGGKVVYDITR